MQQYEFDYAKLIEEIMQHGTNKETRNGLTRSVFGRSIVVRDLDKYFPIIQGRKMYPQGVLGELAAMLRKPKCKEDFEKWGCNYWEKWCKEDGTINVDYGNYWFEHGQIDRLKDSLANNPNDRRMIISGWNPANLDDLDLPCCHYSYQFYVADGKLSMIWTQRSVDMMIGLPSDFILGAAWLIAVANEFDLVPHEIKFDLGDCHIYSEHVDKAVEYTSRVQKYGVGMHPVPYINLADTGKDFCLFEPSDIDLDVHASFPPIKFELKA